ncbi:type II secretion system F family protein [Candidatus Babeliales bacterium]|nr:type II secretion system F family protein [Candidatus Babeliales bacterium]
MPYFIWKGLDLAGEQQEGSSFAETYKELENLLLEHDIALLDAHITQPVQKASSYKLSRKELLNILQHLGLLLDSGLLVPDALAVIAAQITTLRIKNLLEDIGERVQAGESLAQVMESIPKLFPALIVAMVHAGEVSGSLGDALGHLSDHLERMESFYKAFRSAALVPLVTLSFFIIISGVLLTCVVPHFASVILSVGGELPWSTRLLLNLSAWCMSFKPLVVVAMVVVGLIGAKIAYLNDERITYFVDRLVLMVPGIGGFTARVQLMSFFASLSMLLARSVSIVNALECSVHSISNLVLHEQCMMLSSLVLTGNSLSDAVGSLNSFWFDQEVRALVRIGEESSRLAQLIDRVASRYREHIENTLSMVTLLVQPTLLILLGGLIAALIMAIYVPIFTLSDTIGFGGVR